MSKILIVDDETAIREMVSFSLQRNGFEVIEAGDCHAALLKLADDVPDLILLDWMLPDLSGVDFARRLRKEANYKETPIIMLTARGEEDDKIRGLESGADDYITKPFSPGELVARIKAVLRRTTPALSDDAINAGGLEMDLQGHRVSTNGTAIELGPTEFRLLQFFMTHAERVYTRSQLLDQVWGNDVYVGDRTVDVHIRRLRKALEPSGREHLIQTVRGTGYRFSAKD
ncbi:phosphate regulon transcriptional regulator PhoB [Pseudomonadota bacterium]